MIENLCLADCELIALTAHILDQNGKVKFTASGYFEAVHVVGFLDTEADIGVKLAEQTVT